MYSRITNMYRIEDFGTISGETSLQIESQKKSKKNHYYFFFRRITFNRGAGRMKEKRPYLQVPIHKPLNVETLFISLPSFSFLFFFFFFFFFFCGRHNIISVVGR